MCHARMNEASLKERALTVMMLRVQISGARVKLSDAPRGVSERFLRLSGTPEQVQAAINLVQVMRPPTCGCV